MDRKGKYWNGDGKPKVGEIVNVKVSFMHNDLPSGEVVYIGQSDNAEKYVVQCDNLMFVKEIEGIKPGDTRTDKEKAIDLLFVDMPQSTVKKALEYAYDKWVGDKK